MPEPERRIWNELRAARLNGIKFRRQKVIGPYIVDFASNDPKLVVEIDGESHADRGSADTARTKYLEAQTYTVIRFSNLEVMSNPEGVLARIASAAEALRSPPPPTPSPEGEGASR